MEPIKRTPIEGNTAYTFSDPEIWRKDTRMGEFAADLKSATWRDIAGTSTNMKILRLKHLFLDDDMPDHEVAMISGDDKRKNWIFLRPEAKEIWDHMFTCLTTRAAEDEMAFEHHGRGFFRVSGNSGIGKSYSMLYILKEFLDRDRLVFYDDRGNEKIYAFIPIPCQDNTVKYDVYITSVSNFKAGKRYLLRKYPEETPPPVLWDPTEESTENFAAGYLWYCRTAVAVSIKENLVTNAHKHYEVDDRYMPQYSLTQLETIRDLAYR